MANLANLFDKENEVYDLCTEETSSARHLVLNKRTKQMWVNITLPCANCDACSRRIESANALGLATFPLENMSDATYNNMRWAEIPYPDNGDVTAVERFGIFTPTRIEKRDDTLEDRFGEYFFHDRTIAETIERLGEKVEHLGGT